MPRKKLTQFTLSNCNILTKLGSFRNLAGCGEIAVNNAEGNSSLRAANVVRAHLAVTNYHRCKPVAGFHR
jgi:hypothetical protein